METLQVDASNTEQSRAWDGDEGRYWARNARQFDDSVAGYHGPFMAAAAIEPTDRVLDIGCGTGETTRDAARRAPAGWALGVDLSAAMLAVAQDLTEREGLANARYEQVDAQVHPFRAGAFDVAISRTGAMFFGDPPAAFANIAGALRPGGRLALLVWQDLPRNEWIVAFSTALASGRALPAPPPGAPGPFSLSDPDRTRSLLQGAGFTSVRFEPLAAPMSFGRDPDDAFDLVHGLLGWMVADLDPDARTRALQSLRADLAAHRTPAGVRYESACWLVTATRP